MTPSVATQTIPLLLIDDQTLILQSLASYLNRYYSGSIPIQLYTAENTEEALRCLAAEPAMQLIVSDLRLKETDGGKLLSQLRTQCPDARLALMSAYYLEDTISVAREHGIVNILTKGVPFDFPEFSRALEHQIHPEKAFGLLAHTTSINPEHINTFTLKSTDDIALSFNKLQTFFNDLNLPNANDFCTALIEGLTNSIYHAYASVDNPEQDKYEKGERVESLLESEYVTLTYGASDEWLGVSIQDQGGRLDPHQALYWMEKNFSEDNLLDVGGRGLFLIYMLADRMIINIEPGKRTEVILLARRDRSILQGRESNKPLYINVV